MAVIAEWTFEGSLKLRKEQALTGTKPVINEERMTVRGKWTICQIEWYRGNNEMLLTSQASA